MMSSSIIIEKEEVSYFKRVIDCIFSKGNLLFLALNINFIIIFRELILVATIPSFLSVICLLNCFREARKYVIRITEDENSIKFQYLLYNKIETEIVSKVDLRYQVIISWKATFIQSRIVFFNKSTKCFIQYKNKVWDSDSIRIVDDFFFSAGIKKKFGYNL